jgi:hypothetical protein
MQAGMHVRGVLELIVGLEIGQRLTFVEEDILALHSRELKRACGGGGGGSSE